MRCCPTRPLRRPSRSADGVAPVDPVREGPGRARPNYFVVRDAFEAPPSRRTGRAGVWRAMWCSRQHRTVHGQHGVDLDIVSWRLRSPTGAEPRGHPAPRPCEAVVRPACRAGRRNTRSRRTHPPIMSHNSCTCSRSGRRSTARRFLKSARSAPAFRSRRAGYLLSLSAQHEASRSRLRRVGGWRWSEITSRGDALRAAGVGAGSGEGWRCDGRCRRGARETVKGPRDARADPGQSIRAGESELAATRPATVEVVGKVASGTASAALDLHGSSAVRRQDHVDGKPAARRGIAPRPSPFLGRHTFRWSDGRRVRVRRLCHVALRALPERSARGRSHTVREAEFNLNHPAASHGLSCSIAWRLARPRSNFRCSSGRPDHTILSW